MITVRVGTRGSVLSRRQTEAILAVLRELHPGVRFEAVVIQTHGDRWAGPLSQAARPGMFVAELERALQEGFIDLAVHSLKDLPTSPTPGLVIAAIPPREDPRDALVANAPSLAQLPPGARVGTSSPRRTAQLRAYRKDLEVVPLRGNVDTRIRKVQAGVVDAAILAVAGLVRGGWEQEITERLDPEVMLPAPGQGAIALQVREDDAGTRSLVEALDDPLSRAAVSAERAFLRRLGGGCALPAAALATCDGATNTLRLRGLVAAPDGSRVVRVERVGPIADAEEIGQQAAEAICGPVPPLAS
ncbi:MAG: hydroxymethylbilane synthase [Armatimonadota bacterium]|nr:hydroxymethylbilane synthase [Armatimonadota bacterium]MDR7439061.1 hydroxymethylbilane synthase [Armatimonadota bacterium]MDR7563002.1 hydroxymethylbilane synthase [Armatimonadota bacterium]MDR7567925.1 hydroxymethylbilane synthase [Armatimonadota bacterium]MDR7600846.1 hydroxymethylbilane synthase [Armatimonadota bacterium]